MADEAIPNVTEAVANLDIKPETSETSIGTENSRNFEFDWEQGLPDQMYEFTMDRLDQILEVAIEKVVPAKNSKFNPIGANVIFLCTRYAAYERSDDIANECLLSAVYRIGSWVTECEPEDYTYAYWLANSIQLLVYLKKDMKTMLATVESQLQLTEVVNLTFQKLIDHTVGQFTKLADSAYLHHDMDLALGRVQLENDYLGLAGRKSLLTSESRSYTSIFTSIFTSHSSNVTPLEGTIVLTDLLTACKRCALHVSVIEQIFSTVFGWLHAYVYDRTIASKSNCCRAAAKQISLNVASITDWINDPRNLKTVTRDSNKFIQMFKPLNELLDFLQNITSYEDSNHYKQELKNYNSLSRAVMHHVASLYRYEVGEKTIRPKIEMTIQESYEQERAQIGAVSIFKGEKFEIGSLKVPINPDGSLLWTTFPHIPAAVVKVWLN